MLLPPPTGPSAIYLIVDVTVVKTMKSCYLFALVFS